jgi:hypothetical protein
MEQSMDGERRDVESMRIPWNLSAHQMMMPELNVDRSCR